MSVPAGTSKTGSRTCNLLVLSEQVDNPNMKLGCLTPTRSPNRNVPVVSSPVLPDSGFVEIFGLLPQYAA